MLEVLLNHITLYPVLVPIFGCLVILFFGLVSRKLFLSVLDFLLLLVSTLGLVIAIKLQQEVLVKEVLSYHLGGWIPPFGIEIRIDNFNALVLLVVAFVNFIAITFIVGCCKHEVAHHNPIIFWALWLLAVTGLSGMVITGDLFNLYVFLEISSLATYVLVAGGKGRSSLSASFTYLVIGSLGAAFFFTGLIFLYTLTGTLNMQDIITVVSQLPADRTFIAAFCFMVLGLATKAALFPVHLWLPNVYAFTTGKMIIIHLTTLLVSLYALLRVMTLLAPVIDINSSLVLPFVAFAMIINSFCACVQRNYRQLLAYSSIAHIGFIVLGVVFGTEITTSAGLVYFFVYALTKVTLLIALLTMDPIEQVHTLRSFRGTWQKNPYEVVIFLYAAASLVGIPGTLGFVVKWEMFRGALLYPGSKWMIIIAMIISTVLSLIYLGRLAWQIFSPAPAELQVTNSFKNNCSRTVLGFLTCVAFFLALNPHYLFVPAQLAYGVVTAVSGVGL